MKQNFYFENFKTVSPINLKPNEKVCIEGQYIAIRRFDEIKNKNYSYIDCENLHLLPGFIDCHVHISMNSTPNPFEEFNDSTKNTVSKSLINLRKSISCGFTTLRDLGGLLEPIMQIRNAVALDSTLPNLLVSGSALCPRDGHGDKISLTHVSHLGLLENLDLLLKNNVDVIKIMASGGVISSNSTLEDVQFTASELSIIDDFSKKNSIPVAAHAQSILSVKNCLKSGIRSIEHGVNLDNECIELMLENDAYLIPTLSAPYHMVNNLEALKFENYIVEKLIQAKERHEDSIIKAYRSDVKIALGTDAGTPFNRHGNNIQEMNLMKKIGISIEDVICSATKYASEILNISKDIGEIAHGKKADLVVMELQKEGKNVFNKEKIKYVFKNGTIV